MNNMYLIPANSKKSLLLFNTFRPFDLMLFGTGALVSMILLFVLPGDSLTALVIKLAPVATTGFLVLPLPSYHNVLIFIREVYGFYMNRRIYLWKGWCANYGEDVK